MNYKASITDFFASPKWGMNLLLGSVAALIPAVGPIVLSGWLVVVFWARRDNEDPARFPVFDFQFFVKYLERGLWPFLVNLVAGLAFVPLMMIMVVAVMFGAGAFAPHAGSEAISLLALAMLTGAGILYLALMVVFYLVTVPLTLRATITQGFTQAFNLGFVKNFLALMWKEALVIWIFLFGLGIAMMIVTVVTCYIGLFPSVVILTFAIHHLQKQLYQIYLGRGGEAIALSPDLIETPPALPPIVG